MSLDATTSAPQTPAGSRAGPSHWSVALQDLGDPTDFVEGATTRLATVERDAPTGRASADLHRRSTRSSAACPAIGPGARVIPQADPPTGTPLPLSDGLARPKQLLEGSRSGRRAGAPRACRRAPPPQSDAAESVRAGRMGPAPALRGGRTQYPPSGEAAPTSRWAGLPGPKPVPSGVAQPATPATRATASSFGAGQGIVLSSCAARRSGCAAPTGSIAARSRGSSSRAVTGRESPPLLLVTGDTGVVAVSEVTRGSPRRCERRQGGTRVPPAQDTSVPRPDRSRRA